MKDTFTVSLKVPVTNEHFTFFEEKGIKVVSDYTEYGLQAMVIRCDTSRIDELKSVEWINNILEVPKISGS